MEGLNIVDVLKEDRIMMLFGFKVLNCSVKNWCYFFWLLFVGYLYFVVNLSDIIDIEF